MLFIELPLNYIKTNDLGIKNFWYKIILLDYTIFMSREVVEKRTLGGLGSEGRKSVTAASRPKVLMVTSRLWRLTPFTAHAVPLPLQAGGGKFLEVTPLPMNGKGKGGLRADLPAEHGHSEPQAKNLSKNRK